MDMKNLLLVIGNSIGVIGTILVNALAVILPLNGKSTSELSDAIPNLFVPAGITFSIWSIIYLFLIMFMIYQIISLYKKRQLNIDYIEKIIPKKKQFIDNIVKSRNYYVHYDYAIEKKALRGSMLFETFKKLRLILICCLLQNLGISKKMLCDRLSKTEYIMGHNL